MQIRSYLKSEIDLFTNASEQWKEDHKEAMRVRDLEDTIAHGIRLAKSLTEPTQGRMTVDDVINYLNCLEIVFVGSQNLILAAEDYINQGYRVERLDELKDIRDEFRSVLRERAEARQNLLKIQKGEERESANVVIGELRSLLRDCSQG